MKGISILGSSGSIGTQALDVIKLNCDSLCVVALACGSNIELLESQIREFNPSLVSVVCEKAQRELRIRLRDYSKPIEILCGSEGLEAVTKADAADMVVGALPGSVGLKPAFWSLQAGKELALATKEVLVMAGKLFMEQVQASGIKLIPVDSEQSAIFQCLQGNLGHELKRILLTASGGPFLMKSAEDMASVGKEETLRHPRWKMGPKVTVDSATLMNKGLEVIEARWLFGIESQKIEVLIHPQSIVHSMVEFADGSIMAQMGTTDMRIPISYALAYPLRIPSGTNPLDLTSISSLSFHKPDMSKFPLLKASYDSLSQNENVYPVILNAADEVAVDMFLKEKIPFNSIHRICLDALNLIPCRRLESLEDIELFHEEVSRVVRAKWDRPS